MKQFFFKLESVLAYRKLLEDEEKRKLKDIRAKVLETQRLKEELIADIEDHGRMLTERTRGVLDMERIRHLNAYLGKLRNDVILASRLLEALDKDWRDQVEKLMLARQRREAVEKLKTKGFKLHEKELRELEGKLHDELSVTQFGRLDRQDLP